MPRGARLDAPGTLHHVMLRGIERGNIVYDDEDREDFLTRMGDQARATGSSVYGVKAGHSNLQTKIKVRFQN